MALILLNNNGTPYGQFDGYDNLSLLGGEVATLVAYDSAGSDKHAKDIEDGYVVQGPATTMNVRPVVSTTLASGSRPLFLTDEGTSGYGTLFGTLVGGNVGQVVSGGTTLGPNTMAGSGKVTLWKNPGLYGVTFDAMEGGSGGVSTANTGLTIGSALVFTNAGKLTPSGGTNAVGGAPTVARLVEFSTGDTLVTTPRSLTRVGTVGGMLQFKYAVIDWIGGAL